jgi:hypothetical protein
MHVKRTIMVLLTSCIDAHAVTVLIVDDLFVNDFFPLVDSHLSLVDSMVVMSGRGLPQTPNILP